MKIKSVAIFKKDIQVGKDIPVCKCDYNERRVVVRGLITKVNRNFIDVLVRGLESGEMYESSCKIDQQFMATFSLRKAVVYFQGDLLR